MRREKKVIQYEENHWSCVLTSNLSDTIKENFEVQEVI